MHRHIIPGTGAQRVGTSWHLHNNAGGNITSTWLFFKGLVVIRFFIGDRAGSPSRFFLQFPKDLWSNREIVPTPVMIAKDYSFGELGNSCRICFCEIGEFVHDLAFSDNLSIIFSTYFILPVCFNTWYCHHPSHNGFLFCTVFKRLAVTYLWTESYLCISRRPFPRVLFTEGGFNFSAVKILISFCPASPKIIQCQFGNGIRIRFAELLVVFR